MKADEYLFETCRDLKDGESHKCDLLGYTVHKYSDGYWALWHQPSSSLGRHLHTVEQLRKFMVNGSRNAGSAITVDMREVKL